jgi:hypothetical protein
MKENEEILSLLKEFETALRLLNLAVKECSFMDAIFGVDSH